MKKTIFLFISVCFLIPAYSQFQLGHWTGQIDYGNSIRTLYYGEAYIIGGQTDFYFYSTGTDATLLKTDYNGNILWSKVYGLKGWEIFNSVRPIYPYYDAGYVCLGSTNSMGYGGNDMLFVSTDRNGVPASVYTYGGKEWDEGRCIQVIEDHETGEQGLIMIGSSESFTSDASSKMFIVKTRLDGSYTDAVVVGSKGNQYGYWIEQTEDGGFIAVGANDFAYGMEPGSNLDIYVVKLNSKLDVEWSRIIGGGPELPYDDKGHSVKEIEEGYIVTGFTQSFGTRNTNDAFLLKLDRQGNLLWLRNYGYTSDDVGWDVLNEEQTPVNHQYILSGHTVVNNRYYALLLATDYNGNIMWTRGYGYDSNEMGFEMDRAFGRGYTFTGYESFTPGRSGVYQVVTNDIGDSHCPMCEIDPPIKSEKHPPCIYEERVYRHVETGLKKEIESWDIMYETTPCDAVNNPKSAESEFSNADMDTKGGGIPYPGSIDQKELMLFPNPANELVRVQYPGSYQHGQLKVFNNTGQLILSKVLLDPTGTEVALDNLDKGIYWITVINKSGESLNTNLLITK